MTHSHIASAVVAAAIGGLLAPAPGWPKTLSCSNLECFKMDESTWYDSGWGGEVTCDTRQCQGTFPRYKWKWSDTDLLTSTLYACQPIQGFSCNRAGDQHGVTMTVAKLNCQTCLYETFREVSARLSSRCDTEACTGQAAGDGSSTLEECQMFWKTVLAEGDE